ncbi:HTTM domain-containing protein [Flavobacterium oreochromis]|uniref:HTTM domain-containing protein n=1 Tax=Flavobacterium oreochromis TaxID=2906078 RepID=UPI001CE58A0F|nr:HTTM domain-containing protein [Flavobacterium oreochromis]QYS86081.1 HTTM domain-containing protein [Flavobacterium oreochromis]
MGINIKSYFKKTSFSETLAFYRIAFGFMMLFSIIRFWSYGWIEKLYITPKYHFTYFGFEWIKPLGIYTYLIFFICGLSAFFVALGYRYKIAAISFFLSFTYIELMDKTTYLNHYYFISIISFILIFLPVNCNYSLDVYLDKFKLRSHVSQWNIDILKLMLGIVYFYAGLIKLNSDWLLEAQPLKTWLPMNSGLPIIGTLLLKSWVHYGMSWAGAIYDLSIPFLLLNKRTRIIGFILVVVFHIFTKILFPIGVFPYVMIISTLIYFSQNFHKKILQKTIEILHIPRSRFETTSYSKATTSKFSVIFLSLFMLFQLIFPFRYLLYPQELFWTEEGFRFSWRVMLMEKAGYTQFKIVDQTGKVALVDNHNFLTPFQEKQMSFQPDFILEYAHILKKYYQDNGFVNPKIYVESFVALNGRLSQPYIDPTVDLGSENESFKHKTWILPFKDEIKGF